MAAGKGILLVGHGTRNDAGVAEFLTLAALLQQRLPETPVAPCFLELQEPTIAAGIDQLAAQGAQHIAVIPLLLFAAGHAKHDIPSAVAAAIAHRPGMTATQAPALDCHPRLVELSQLRFVEAVDNATVDKSLLILVGRGSHDPEATAALHRFASLRHAQGGVDDTRVAFLAMAEPRVQAILEQAAKEDWRRIVVQPHLLFQGDLLTELNQLVADFAARHSGTRWLVAEHLASGIAAGGVSQRLLLDVICDIAGLGRESFASTMVHMKHR